MLRALIVSLALLAGPAVAQSPIGPGGGSGGGYTGPTALPGVTSITSPFSRPAFGNWIVMGNNGSITLNNYGATGGPISVTTLSTSGDTIGAMAWPDPIVSNANFTITALVSGQYDSASFIAPCIFVTTAANLEGGGIWNNTGIKGVLYQWNYTTATTGWSGATGTNQSISIFPDMVTLWLRVKQVGTVRTYSWSNDGYNFVQSATNTSSLTLTRAGVGFCNARNTGITGQPLSMSIWSWTTSTP